MMRTDSRPLFDTVLVANRGEIAVRIIRTLRAMGIRSVAVYSDADAHAPHVTAADVAARIGPAAATQSYLDVERVIGAALATGAQALHPGYGFLAENTALAEACAANGIVFIGPPPAAIDAMGDKIRAKRTVAANGVRVVPGVDGAGVDTAELVARATALGAPLLIKPSAGGGGKGMRLVTDLARLPEEIAAAQREARGAFGDDTLLVERCIERPRHIEVQVLADSFGNVVHLGERECSLQRRHQKVVEEAPSPLLDAAQRAAIGAQAVAAARACGYVNAGTVEFIVDGAQPDEPYFMEMNTRLQVEHPVTEMVWGVDLVELQVRIAAGKPLPFTQDDLAPRGHAIEARLYAEDPSAGFLPTGGRILALREPTHLPHVRVDSGVAVGTEVGSSYDPMLAKTIAWGATREDAVRTLDGALAATTVLGLTTNVAFLRTILADPDVIAGRLDTGLVERIVARVGAPAVPFVSIVAAALAATVPAGPADADPWRDRTGWRLGERGTSRWRALGPDGAPVELRMQVLDAHGHVDVHHADGTTVATAVWERDELRVRLDDVTTTFVVARDGRATWLGAGGDAWVFTEPPLVAPGAAARGAATADVRSPMPGSVVAVHVAVGDTVRRGEPMVVVEAMKMEHTLRAEHDGVVREVSVRAGDTVALHQVLAVVDATDLGTDGIMEVR
jgi:acetyl-CoA/propionyl-CoA carboxylase, biotin carboxylase, biotin carboxyl carrier protein